MSDFDQEKITPGRATPSVAFRRAMTDVETRCNDLATLLDNHDFGQLEHTVRSAANLWLAGRAAYRRLVERDTEANPDVGAARQLLESTYLTLLNLLKRAHTLIDGHPARSMLDDVRITLVTAMAQPVSDAAEALDAEWSGDTQETEIDD